jgi:hypothetical protein
MMKLALFGTAWNGFNLGLPLMMLEKPVQQNGLPAGE